MTPERAFPWPRVWQALIIVGVLVTLAGAPLPLTDGDSAVYGTYAKRILATGEWLTFSPPQSDRIFDKPPLTIWLMALSVRIGGGGAAALRSWQLLMTVALALMVYSLARLHARVTEALLAPLLFLTFGQVFYQGLVPQQDVAMTLFLTLAFYDYLRFRRDGTIAPVARLGLWVGLATLSLGLLGIAWFGLVVAADVTISRLRRESRAPWRWTAMGIACGVFLLVALPWFVIGAARQGRLFVETFLLGSTGISRLYTSILSGNIIPLDRYWMQALAPLLMLLMGMLPWTGLLPGIVASARGALRAGPSSLRFCVLWAGIVLLVLTLSPGDKVIRYLLPCYPPLAVLGARYVTGALDRPGGLRWAAVLSGFIGLAGASAAAWVLAEKFPDQARSYASLVAPFLIAFIAAVVAFAVAAWRDLQRVAVAALAAGILVAFGLLEWQMMQTWERQWPWRTMASVISDGRPPEGRVLIVGVNEAEPFLNYYLGGWFAETVPESHLRQVWQEGRTFALIARGVQTRRQHELNPVVLLEAPEFVLVTNR